MFDDGRLSTYVDVLQVHRLDQSVLVEETLKALNDVVESGKVRYTVYNHSEVDGGMGSRCCRISRRIMIGISSSACKTRSLNERRSGTKTTSELNNL